MPLIKTCSAICNCILLTCQMYCFTFLTVYMLPLLIISYCTMCLHPLTRRFDSLNREITSIRDSLDEFDSCDYVNGQFCSCISDLCIVQLNIRGICSKQSQLKNLINNCVKNRSPDIIIISETWLTPFSPEIKYQVMSSVTKIVTQKGEVVSPCCYLVTSGTKC